MEFVNTIASWLYADGDMVMSICNVIAFVFSLETIAYLISLITMVVGRLCK
ncbi:MAG: hypothetical protein IJZ96_01815 [Lachnospiraceae bacterium]|nr:hypothetical protein [Lachnospiraceae bacterium]